MDAYTTNEPIYALATAYAPSAIAIVRLSGDGVIDLLSSVFDRPEKLKRATTNQITLPKMFRMHSTQRISFPVYFF